MASEKALWEESRKLCDIKNKQREWHAKVPELNLITRQQKSRFLTGGQLLAFHAFTNGS